MNKKGFTMIEIIICIAIIGVIGVVSIIGIKSLYNKNNNKKLNALTEKIYQAAQVYLETNKEASTNIENGNGAVIPLKILEKEGLMDFKNINIENQYVVAALGTEKLETTKENNTSSETCLGMTLVNTWKWDKSDEKKVIYLCGSNIDNTEINNKINNLTARISELEKTISNNIYVYKEEDPNNWVYFDVNSNNNDLAYWPNTENKNLWRIYNYQLKEENGKKIIYPKKLVYSEKVTSNNNQKLNITYKTIDNKVEFYIKVNNVKNKYELFNDGVMIKYTEDCNGETIYVDDKNNFYRKLSSSLSSDRTKTNIYIQKINNLSSCYCKTLNDKERKWMIPSDGFLRDDFTFSEGSKLYILYTNIVNKNFILETNYNMRYYMNDTVFGGLDYAKSEKTYLGIINKEEIDIIQNTNNWLSNVLDNSYLGTINPGIKYGNHFVIYQKNQGNRVRLLETYRIENSYNGQEYAVNYIPAITMNDGVKVISGDGSKTNPYILSYNGVSSHKE